MHCSEGNEGPQRAAFFVSFHVFCRFEQILVHICPAYSSSREAIVSDGANGFNSSPTQTGCNRHSLLCRSIGNVVSPITPSSNISVYDLSALSTQVADLDGLRLKMFKFYLQTRENIVLSALISLLLFHSFFLVSFDLSVFFCTCWRMYSDDLPMKRTTLPLRLIR